MSISQPATATNIEVQLGQPASKFECERNAFFHLLPQLLTSHKGQYVAIHDGKVVDSGDNRLEVALRVLKRVGNVDIFVGFVSQSPEPASRSGVRREVNSTSQS